jgi:ankyrin repeat protein
MSAVTRGQVEAVKLLIDSGVDVNFQDDRGETALIFALDHETQTQPEIIRLLLDAGADVNSQSSLPGQEGMTLLDIAIEEKNEEVTDILRQAGGLTQEELEAGNQ